MNRRMNVSNLEKHAKCELTRAGLFRKDSDYEGMIGHAVMALVKVFAKQGHSWFSAAFTRQVFVRVADFKVLSPLTNDPSEWMQVSRKPPCWQSRRQPSCFSDDRGKTYHDIDEKPRRTHTSKPVGGGKDARERTIRDADAQFIVRIPAEQPSTPGER